MKTIFKSTSKILLTAFLLIASIYVGRIQGTNATFSTHADADGSTLSAGYWLPELTMMVQGSDAGNGWYKTQPCVTLAANIHGATGGITIYYEFSNDGDPIAGGTKYTNGACIQIPDGNPTNFQAQAVNDANSNWKSNIVSESFKVYTAGQSGDVVINEVMWMGTKQSDDDEWIELRNTTDHDIDLSNWKILNGGNGSASLNIPNGYTIKANSYFLILKKKWNETEVNLSGDLAKDEGLTNVAGMGLKNSGEQLTLQDEDKNTIDIAGKDSGWPAGWHGLLLHMSMERNKIPGDGTKSSNWHTCISLKGNNKTYWRHEGFNFGTPGAVNLSENDPTDESYDPAAMEQKIEDQQDTSDDASVDATLATTDDTTGVTADTNTTADTTTDGTATTNSDAQTNSDTTANNNSSSGTSDNQTGSTANTDSSSGTPAASADSGTPADNVPQSGGDTVIPPPVVTPTPETKPADDTPAIETPRAVDSAPPEVKADTKAETDSKVADDKPADPAPPADSGTSASQ